MMIAAILKIINSLNKIITGK